MPNPIAPRMNGDDYQARHFWKHALDLLDPHSGVNQVGYEYKEVKPFDDVCIFYDPPKGQAHHQPLSRHFMQIKWHSTRSHRFGYLDLADPAFIGATSVSLLARLKEATDPDGPVTRLSLVTTAQIADCDPLAELVSTEDGVLRLDKLQVGKTPRSKMGMVRQHWRNTLSLSSDDDLLAVLTNFAIRAGQPDMEEMQEIVTMKAKSVGILPPLSSTSASDFRFDSLARQLIKRNISVLDRNKLVEFLKHEGVSIAPTLDSTTEVTQIGIRSFTRLSSDISSLQNSNVLSLLTQFDGRYLRSGCSWKDVSDKIDEFCSQMGQPARAMRLVLDAHASIAFAAGRVLHLKSGVRSELVQNGRRGTEIWHAEDGSNSGAAHFIIRAVEIGPGPHLAVAISVARSTVENVKNYLLGQRIPVGRLLVFELPDGPNQSGISGGQHAAALSDQVTTAIGNIRSEIAVKFVHLFVSAPNSFLFYLGQHAQAIGPHQMYEFDFDGARGGSYIPSVRSLRA